MNPPASETIEVSESVEKMELASEDVADATGELFELSSFSTQLQSNHALAYTDFLSHSKNLLCRRGHCISSESS